MDNFNEPILNEKTTSSANQYYANLRLLKACRTQYEFKTLCLEDLIDKDHVARKIWEFVDDCDPTISLKQIKSFEGRAGRPAIDPKILLALWIYATIAGIGSAEELSEYCKDHNGFKWICGGISIDRKTISDFRKNEGGAFEELLVNSVATLTRANIVTLTEISQDGLKVRASAGKHTFRKAESLQEHIKEAEERVKILKEELEKDASQSKSRKKNAQLVAKQERLEKLNQAKEELKNYISEKEEEKKRNKKKALTDEQKGKMRVSLTDPEARIMKMADGGFRPAYNIQFAVDTASQVVVGVSASNMGNDNNAMIPMFKYLTSTYNKVIERYLIDGGYKNKNSIITAYKENCKIYIPCKKRGEGKKNSFSPTDKDEAIRECVSRMETEEASKIYNRRASTVECVNAQVRNRGFYRFMVRGLKKVQSMALLMAVGHNFMRFKSFKLV